MIDQLKKDIASLEEYRKKLEKQQLSFPVDDDSVKTIRGSAFYSLGNVVPFSLASPYNESSTIIVGDKKYLLDTTPFLDLSL